MEQLLWKYAGVRGFDGFELRLSTVDFSGEVEDDGSDRRCNVQYQQRPQNILQLMCCPLATSVLQQPIPHPHKAG